MESGGFGWSIEFGIYASQMSTHTPLRPLNSEHTNVAIAGADSSTPTSTHSIASMGCISALRKLE